ncbi:hypothetical protein ABT340_39030 [Streptosporangium sp. NPDC000239]|uniref:hypothetical protein n=1 Tax=Streptosporangium sp. NPDC000239 TaxID=3154248 RepID=UPI00332C737F
MFTMRWPDHFDEYAPVIEAKGWFGDVLVEWNGRIYRPVFYEPVRLAQEISDELARGSAFREPNLIVIDQVTRAHMEAAITALVDGRFDLVPEEGK